MSWRALLSEAISILRGDEIASAKKRLAMTARIVVFGQTLAIASVTIPNLVTKISPLWGFLVLKILLAINIPPLRGYCASETWPVRSYYESPDA